MFLRLASPQLPTLPLWALKVAALISKGSPRPPVRPIHCTQGYSCAVLRHLSANELRAGWQSAGLLCKDSAFPGAQGQGQNSLDFSHPVELETLKKVETSCWWLTIIWKARGGCREHRKPAPCKLCIPRCVWSAKSSKLSCSL